MSVTREEVRHIARLARLRLAEDEKAALAAEMSRILAYVEQLQALDTAEVPPMAHVLELGAVTREDVVRQRISREAALGCAPAADEAYFRVPKVIE